MYIKEEVWEYFSHDYTLGGVAWRSKQPFLRIP